MCCGNETSVLCGNETSVLWGNETNVLWGNETSVLWGMRQGTPSYVCSGCQIDGCCSTLWTVMYVTIV